MPNSHTELVATKPDGADIEMTLLSLFLLDSAGGAWGGTA